MQQHFDLELCNYRLYVWLGIVGVLAALLAAALAASHVPSGGFQLVVMAVVSGMGFYGVYQLQKKATIHPAQLAVDADGLIVHYLLSDKVTRISFGEVVSYRDEWLRDGHELRFRLRSGKKVRLATNNFLAPSEGYGPLLQAVQRVIAQRNATSPFAISREKSFFERPFATILLIISGVAVLVAVGSMLFGHKPFQASILTVMATWAAYFAMWRAARANR